MKIKLTLQQEIMQAVLKPAPTFQDKKYYAQRVTRNIMKIIDNHGGLLERE